MRLLHRDVEFDFSSKRTGNLQNIKLVILLFTLYRSFDTSITAKKAQICREFSITTI